MRRDALDDLNAAGFLITGSTRAYFVNGFGPIYPEELFFFWLRLRCWPKDVGGLPMPWPRNREPDGRQFSLSAKLEIALLAILTLMAVLVPLIGWLWW